MQISVHESYFGLHKKLFETYTMYSGVADKEQIKNMIKGVFYENLAVDIKRKLYIRVHIFFILYFWVHRYCLALRPLV